MYTILVVEDDTTLIRGLEYTLTKEGWKVFCAGDIEKAKNIFYAENIDLILLDVMLPDGSGYDFCGYVREKSDIPVIFLTACDEEVNVILGLETGADDYIIKPFRIGELVARIKVVLKRTGREDRNSDMLSSSGLTLNLSARKVFKKDMELTITGTEFKLLHILMSNSYKVLTRETILDKLWDFKGEFVDDNTLSVYIRRLREKIEDDPADPEFILTVRGTGYKWNKGCE